VGSQNLLVTGYRSVTTTSVGARLQGIEDSLPELRIRGGEVPHHLKDVPVVAATIAGSSVCLAKPLLKRSALAPQAFATAFIDGAAMARSKNPREV
jgi:hypothetical protein